MKNFITTLLIIASIGLSAQSTITVKDFQAIYGKSTGFDFFQDVVETYDKSLISVGRTESYSSGINLDILVVKTSHEGKKEKILTIGGNGQDYCQNIITTKDSGFALLCGTTSFGAGMEDLLLVKCDKNFNIEWAKTYGGTNVDQPRLLENTKDGGFLISARTQSYSAGLTDLYVIKVDEKGIVEWANTYGGTDHETAAYAKEAPDGNIYVTGHTYSFGASTINIALLKLNSKGQLLWFKSLSTSDNLGAHDINYYNDTLFITGSFIYTPSNRDGFAAALDTSGNPLWGKKYGNSNTYESLVSLDINPTEIYLNGTGQKQGNSDKDIFILKIKRNGDIDKNILFGGPEDDESVSDFALITNNKFVVAGFSSILQPSGDASAYLIKASKDLDSVCNSTIPNVATSNISFTLSNHKVTPKPGVITKNVNLSFTTHQGDDSIICSYQTQVTGTSSKDNKPEILVFPNPFKNSITITLPNKFKHPTINLYDLNGRLLISKTIRDMSRVVLHTKEDLPKGIYSIQIITSEEIYYEKVIKN